MAEGNAGSWEPGSETIADLAALRGRFAEVHELAVSPDGRRVAAPVLAGPDAARVWVSDGEWEGEFEKAWHLRFLPDGRLCALVRIDDEWTVAIDGVPWEGRWEFVWNPTW
nr:hypothetical protein [Thermoanaerobaculales bacterium]